MRACRLATVSLFFMMFVPSAVPAAFAAEAHTCTTAANCITELATIDSDHDTGGGNEGQAATLTVGSAGGTITWNTASGSFVLPCALDYDLTVQGAGSLTDGNWRDETPPTGDATTFDFHDATQLFITPCEGGMTTVHTFQIDDNDPDEGGQSVIQIGSSTMGHWCETPCVVIHTFLANLVADRLIIWGPPGGGGTGTGGGGPYGLVYQFFAHVDTSSERTERFAHHYQGSDQVSSWPQPILAVANEEPDPCCTTPGDPVVWNSQSQVVYEDGAIVDDEPFGGLYSIDGNHGSRINVRHVYIQNNGISTHGADSADFSALMMTIRNTEFAMNGTCMAFVVYIRGGTARLYSNTLTLDGPVNTSGYNVGYAFSEQLHRAENITSTCGDGPLDQPSGITSVTNDPTGCALEPDQCDDNNDDDYQNGPNGLGCLMQPGFGVDGMGGHARMPIYIWDTEDFEYPEQGCSDGFLVGNDNNGNLFIGTSEAQASSDDNVVIVNLGQSTTAPTGYVDLAYPHPLRSQSDGPTLMPAGTSLRILN